MVSLISKATKLLALLFLTGNLLLATCNLFAQPVTQEWAKRFTNGSYAGGISVKLDSAGNVYVLAKSSLADSTSGDYCVIKYGNAGNFIWSAFYNSPGNFTDNPVAFAVTGLGDIYITGTSGINFSNHITTVKFNTNGVLQWAKVYNGGGPGDDANDITLDKQGNICVFGGTQVSSALSIALAIKYNPNGDTLWVRKFNQLGPHYSVSSKAAIDDSGNIYTIGSFETYYLTLKYDTNGSLQWYSTYDDPQHLGDAGFCIAVDTNRNVYVVGTNGVPYPGNANNTLVKMNSAGITQWASVYKGISNNSSCGFPAAVVSTVDGSSIYYITSCQWTGGSDFVTLKYNSNGDSVWVRRFNESSDNGIQNNPSALKFDRYSNVYICGAVNNVTSGYDYATLKYSSNGILQWIATYNGPLTSSDDGASDLIIDTNLNVYVTGTSSRQNSPTFLWDAATIKYSQPIGIINNNNQLPQVYKLEQNYPNPFNPITVINYELPKRSSVRLSVYNSIGQLVKTLVNMQQSAGYYSIILNADNFASGVYFYSLISDNSLIETKKFILLK